MSLQIPWAEIDLAAIGHNVRELRRVTDPKARFMAVVKADGYGHGAAEVSKTALANGADLLGVARIDEGVALREAGFAVPILIFGYAPAERADELIHHDLTQTVSLPEHARMLSERATRSGRKIRVHLKIDTGMGRLGIVPFVSREARNEAVRAVQEIRKLPGLDVEGIYTHFAASDSLDKTYAELQLTRFQAFLEELRAKGITFAVRHAANSGAIMDLPDAHFDMVRAGIALYGLYPSDEVDQDRVQLRPAMALKSRIVHLKTVPEGFSVSYAMTWQAPKPTTIATVPIGYADGFNRLLSSRGHMLVRGRRAPIAGRVCMDLTMLDVGRIPEVTVGDEVVIFGSQSGETLPADEIAAKLNTINYEVVSSITGRVRRIHFGGE